MELWLKPIPPQFHENAVSSLEKGEVIGFLGSASNIYGLELVIMNQVYLKKIGLYEKALLDAWTTTRGNWSQYRYDELYDLFSTADKTKLLEAGDPLPNQKTFVAYRGVAGKGRKRRVRGFSWTLDQEMAQWFANRFSWLGDLAVFKMEFSRQEILAYMNDREEQEIIMLPDFNIVKARRVKGDS